MFSSLPEELLWDALFPMLDKNSLCHVLLLCKDMLSFTRKKQKWWDQRIKKDKLYTCRRPYPEYKTYSGIVFLRLTTQKTCFSCLQPTNKTHAVYHIPVCKECSQEKIPYRMITKSTAMKEYCLQGKEVDTLPHLQVANPRFRNAAPMRLYMLVDVLAKKGDRDVQAIKEKKQQSIQKRRQKKEQLEAERRHTLEQALRQVGIEWRDDSELCDMYVSSRKTSWELEQIVQEMALMKYLHQYTDYRHRLEEEVENLCHVEGYYYQGIWKEASETVKHQYYPLPTTWPWLAMEEKK